MKAKKRHDEARSASGGPVLASVVLGQKTTTGVCERCSLPIVGTQLLSLVRVERNGRQVEEWWHTFCAQGGEPTLPDARKERGRI